MSTSLLISARQSTSDVDRSDFLAQSPSSPPLVDSSTSISSSGETSDASSSPPASSTPSSSSPPERRKKKPYKELTLEEKVQLIRLAEGNAGLSQANIAERYAIAKSNVCRILQRKHEYLRAFECAGFAGSRKRKLRGDPGHHHSHNHAAPCGANQTAQSAARDRSLAPNNPQSNHPRRRPQPSIPAPKPIYGIPMASFKDSPDPSHGDVNDNRLLQIAVDEPFGNETLRAHMYKQHQISRMFMCRCCNWAFPDKTSLHIHMQAKEEGKNIPVSVIGKGNPPVQSQNASSGFGALGAAPQTPTLHVPQARAPNQNPFVPLHLPTLPTHQPLSIVDPNALQAAAASLFPQMAMLRASAPGSTPADELMNKLRERLMLNSLVSQSGFGLAAWLAGLPKMDQSGMGGMGVSNADLMNPKDDSVVDMADEDDEINVDREVDEEMPAEGERQHDNNRIDITDDMAGKPDGKDLELNVHDEHHGSGDNKDSENNDRLRSSDLSAGSTTSEGSLSRPASNTMPNLRSAISASPLNSRVPKKRHLESNDTLLNIVSSERSEELPSGGENHVSPTDTHSSVSPSTECGRDCYDCSVYKGKLAVSENRCRYLEGRTATLQSDAIRFSTRASVSENSARQFDQEGRLLRDQNELLQRKLLECQEKTLAFMQGEQAVNPQAVVMYLNDILKTTFLR